MTQILCLIGLGWRLRGDPHDEHPIEHYLIPFPGNQVVLLLRHNLTHSHFLAMEGIQGEG